MLKSFKKVRKNEDGAATIEFAILFPFFIGLLFASIEGGWLMTRHMLVERGVDVAMRDIRLGIIKEPTYEDFLSHVCDKVAFVEDCEQNLVISTQVLDNEADVVSSEAVECFDRTATEEELDSFNPSEGHNVGGTQDIVVIKICAIVDPLLGVFGLASLLPTDDSGGFPIRTQTAFLNEPF